MLEDQSEERACLYALGLLPEVDAQAFEAEAAGNERLRQVVAELTESLANLTLSTTSMRLPAEELRGDLLARIAAEPARVTTDRDGLLETINPAFTEMCGYRIEELRGRKPGHLLQGPDSDPAAIATLRAAIYSGTACEVELVNYHKDGSPYRVHILLEPVRDDRGILVGFRAIERKIAN
jgi:PAS domain S-box-containing protein